MVEFVEYKGKKFPFVYNYYAASRVEMIAEKVSPVEAMDALAYYCIEAGCEDMGIPFTIKKGDEEVDFTMKDAAFLIGQVGLEEIIALKSKFVNKDTGDNKKK